MREEYLLRILASVRFLLPYIFVTFRKRDSWCVFYIYPVCNSLFLTLGSVARAKYRSYGKIESQCEDHLTCTDNKLLKSSENYKSAYISI